MPIKLVHVVGNRPQFIKLAPFLRATARIEGIRDVIIHSGQHYDFEMSRTFFDEMNIPEPDYNLEVGSGTHAGQTGLVLERLEPLLLREKPDMVIVYGDTNTTLAAALCAVKLHLPLAHVESGLREYVWRPEEINRKLSDHSSDLLFCPTQTAVDCIRKEGVDEEKIKLTGDITFDAFLWAIGLTAKKIDKPKSGDYALLTLHRAETVDHPAILKEIVDSLLELPDPIVFPIHPRTKKYLKQYDLWERLSGRSDIDIIPAAGYLPFLKLVMDSKYVITDSGGVIKEAFYAKKPCIVIDSTTEYVEIEQSGSHFWAGKSKTDILMAREAVDLVDVSRIHPEKVFGDGTAAEKMVSEVLLYLERS